MTWLNPIPWRLQDADPGRSSPLQELSQFGKRPCIQHIVCGEPGAARLIDPEPHVLECFDRMRVRRDREFYPGEFRGMGVKIAEVQPVGLRIDLEIAAGLVRDRDHGIHIDVVSLALADQAPGRMRQNGYVTVLQGADDAVGLRLARQIEMRMYGGYDDIQLRQA